MEIVSRMIQLHVFRKRNGETEYLVLQRAKDEPIYPNLWQVITGMVEEGERAEDAALRELKEEVGIETGQLIVVPYIASFFSRPSDAVNLVPVFAVELSPDDDICLSDEHQNFAWLQYGAAINTLSLPSHKEGTRILKDYIIEGADSALFSQWV
jgi:dihydroneopterin triphosphate diphosphatase